MYGEGNPETPWKDSIPLCHVYRDHSGRNAALTERNQESLYTGSRFPSSTSRGPGKSERILQIRKKASQQNKNTDTILCSMSPHSRTTSSRRLQDFPVRSALAPDSERPAILSGTDLYPCFCAAFPPPHWEACHWILSRLWFPTNPVPLPPKGDARRYGIYLCFSSAA